MCGAMLALLCVPSFCEMCFHAQSPSVSEEGESRAALLARIEALHEKNERLELRFRGW